MRPISPALRFAQAVQTPRYTVTCAFENYGQSPVHPPVRWVVWRAGCAAPRPCAAVGLAGGGALLCFAGATGIAAHTLTDATQSSAWLELPAPALLALGVAVGSLDIGAAGAAVRLAYADGAGVWVLASADGGASWGTPEQIAGDLAAADLHVAHVAGWGWVVGWSTGGGLRLAYGSGWALTPVLPAYRLAGVVGDVGGVLLVAGVRQTLAMGDRLTTLRYTAAGGWAIGRRLDAAPGGLLGVQLPWAAVRTLGGLTWALVGESGARGDATVGVGAVWGAAADGGALLDEPWLLPALAGSAAQANRLTLVQAGDFWLLVGDELLVWGTPALPAAWVGTPVRYVYADGELELDLPAGAAGIAPGQLVAVTRGCYAGQAGGTATVRALVMAVEQRRDGVRVVAYDPVGYLGQVRGRRACILAPDEAGFQSAGHALIRLAARAGLAVTCDYPYVLTGAPAGRLTLAPGEALLSALHRLGAGWWLGVVPANDGRFALTCVPVGLDPAENPAFASVSGHYPYSAGAGWFYGAGYEPRGHQAAITHQVRVTLDARRYGLAVVHGLATGDPQDGALVVAVDGPRLDGVRPMAVHVTNRLLQGDAVRAAARAEAQRQLVLQVDAVLTANANLGLEVYDPVTVWEESVGPPEHAYRVLRIREVWERGLLTQEVALVSQEWWNLL